MGYRKVLDSIFELNWFKHSKHIKQTHYAANALHYASIILFGIIDL